MSGIIVALRVKSTNAHDAMFPTSRQSTEIIKAAGYAVIHFPLKDL